MTIALDRKQDTAVLIGARKSGADIEKESLL
jgi:hypothetical protein